MVLVLKILLDFDFDFNIGFLFCINRYDYLRKEVIEEQLVKVDVGAESWRFVIEAFFIVYRDQYYKQGVVIVYGKSLGGNIIIIVCIESY